MLTQDSFEMKSDGGGGSEAGQNAERCAKCLILVTQLDVQMRENWSYARHTLCPRPRRFRSRLWGSVRPRPPRRCWRGSTARNKQSWTKVTAGTFWFSRSEIPIYVSFQYRPFYFLFFIFAFCSFQCSHVAFGSSILQSIKHKCQTWLCNPLPTDWCMNSCMCNGITECKTLFWNQVILLWPFWVTDVKSDDVTSKDACMWLKNSPEQLYHIWFGASAHLDLGGKRFYICGKDKNILAFVVIKCLKSMRNVKAWQMWLLSGCCWTEKNLRKQKKNIIWGDENKFIWHCVQK